MKITDFRKLLTGLNQQDINKIATELYKRIPKSSKEGYDGVDYIIRSITEHQTENKNIQTVDFRSLHDEIDTFLSNANEGYYLKPNRIVSKTERSRWRFAVMHFVKELQKISNTSEDYNDSNIDLLSIYDILSRSCGYYVFRSQDPFAAIGKTQSEYYKILCQRIFYRDLDQNHLPTMIDNATKIYLDRRTLHIFLIKTLISYINTKEDILNTITITEEKVENARPEPSRDAWFVDESMMMYEFKDYIKNLASLVMGLYFKLNEYEKGCQYYWNICNKFEIDVYKNREPQDRKEILFYCLLGLVSSFTDDNKIWIATYDKYKKGTEPRQDLVKKYEEIKNSLVE